MRELFFLFRITSIARRVNFFLNFFFLPEALLSSQITSSIWNVKHAKPYVLSKIDTIPKHTFSKGNVQFYDYCRTVVRRETVDNPRFLNKIYQVVFQYVWESQENAAVNDAYSLFVSFDSLNIHLDFIRTWR